MPQPRRSPGKRRTRDTRATKSTAAEELAPVLGDRRGCGKILASEDFASFLIYVFVRRSLGFFLSSALPGICV
jgi:hypothetical protein